MNAVLVQEFIFWVSLRQKVFRDRQRYSNRLFHYIAQMAGDFDSSGATFGFFNLLRRYRFDVQR